MRNSALKFAVVIPVLTIFLFEGYTLIVQREGELPIPPYFGNSHRTGARLSEKIGKQFHHALLVKVSNDSVSERFVHIDREHDMEDFFERAAIMYVWPWIVRNLVLVYCTNAILLAVLFLALKPRVLR